MKLIWKYLRPYLGYVLIGIILLCIQAFCDLSLPKMMSTLVNDVLRKSAMGLSTKSALIDSSAKMLGVTLIGAIAAISVAYIGAKLGTTMSMNIRRDIFSRVLSFSSKEYNSFSTASLITRSTNDVVQIQNVSVIGMRILAYAPIVGIGGIIMAMRTSLKLSWIIALSLFLVSIIIVFTIVFLMPKFKLLQKYTDGLNLISRENLTGLLIIRAFNTEKREKQRFDEVSTDIKDVSKSIMIMMGCLFPTLIMIINIICVIIIWFGGDLVSRAQLQVGDMMAFMQYSIQIIMSFLMMTMIFVMIPRASVSGARISEVLDTEPSIHDSIPITEEVLDGKNEHNDEPSIVFNNVSFGYDKAKCYVLEDISFTANKGETTAIIGSTGSGKSTLIQLIPRFFDVDKGMVMVNGKDVRDYSTGALRDMIGYISQKGVLFSGDFASNLRFGKPDATEEEIYEALKIAQAAEFVAGKEKGIYDEVSQLGANLSGGQKQRISIARALIKKAPIYIFDDTFSALDYKTDANLRRDLKNYLNDSTIVLVAQRINTIKHADKILVLDEGKIVGEGTHEELLKKCKAYQEIASSQLSKEELEDAR